MTPRGDAALMCEERMSTLKVSLIASCTTAVFVEAGTRATRNIDTALDGREKGVLILTSVESLR